MPITVAHEPSFMITGDYAYRAARQQAQNRVAREQAALASREADRQAQVFNNIVDNQAALQKSREDAQADLEKAKLGNEFKSQDLANRNAFTLGRDRMLSDDRQQLQNKQFQIQGVQQLETQVKDATKAISQQQLTPEGKVISGKLMGNLRAIQKQRTILPPDKYGELLGKWMAEVDSSGLEAHKIEVPKVEDTIKQDTWKDPESGMILGRKKNPQTGEYEIFKVADGAKAEEPKNEAWGKEYNGVPEHEIPDHVYFRDPKKRADSYKSAKEAIEAKYQQEAEKANEGKKDGETLIEPKKANAAEVYAEMRRQREEERKFLKQMEEEQAKADAEIQAEMARQSQGMDTGDIDPSLYEQWTGQPGSVPPAEIPQQQQQAQAPVQIPPPAPGKPSVAPPEAAIPPGKAPDGTMTVRNKDGSTMSFATAEDMAKAAKAAGGVMGMIMELGAKEMAKQKSVKPAPSQEQVPAVDIPEAHAGLMKKYESVLPKGVAEKYKAAMRDDASKAAFLDTPEGSMLYNLDLYEQGETEDEGGKPLIKPMPADKKQIQKSIKTGDIYYIPDPGKPGVMHDAIWDGKKFVILESHQYSKDGEQ